nr:MAG TPA: tail collar fiber protein [Caudoviricetes sp.]
MPGFRAPKKFQNADGSLKQKCYLPAFPGSIGADGKLHSIAGVVSTGNKTISQFLAAARLWGETYSIGTSADFEVLAYLMIVVYGTRSTQEKIRGVSNLYATNVAVTGARTSEAAVTVGKDVLEVGMVISIGTGAENESVAGRRIVTAIEAIEGDTANVKASFTGDPVTTTTDHKIWRIMQSTGTANSVISTCGSPVSNTDGRHSFVFYGVENPLYGNQWRFECDWKLIDDVPYYCDDPTKYQWSSADDYTKLDGLVLPNEGWAKNLQADERFPWLQITKEVGGSSGTYLEDYWWINMSGTRIAGRGASSTNEDRVGAFAVRLDLDAGWAWWAGSADLSIPG